MERKAVVAKIAAEPGRDGDSATLVHKRKACGDFERETVDERVWAAFGAR